MQYTPKDELQRRIGELQRKLNEQNLNGALLRQRTDLFYFAGTIQQSHLFVPAEGDTLLLVRKSFNRAEQESALESVVRMRSLRSLRDLLTEAGHNDFDSLGMELDILPANDYLLYQKKIFPDTDIVDVSAEIREIRTIKSVYEIERMRETAEVMDAMFQRVPELLEAGITEVELAGQLEAIGRQAGHEGEIWMRNWNQALFYGVVLSGENITVPSYFDGPLNGRGLSPAMPTGPSARRIEPGDLVIVDYVARRGGYLLDQTRTFAVGSLSTEWRDHYEAMREIQSAVVKAAGPGAVCGELYQLAVEEADEMGLSDGFMGHGEGQVRFVAHGVGLEIDEYPILAAGVDLELAPGMVLALEPKYIVPGKGGVGIENTWLVTDDGPERLTPSPEELTVVS